MSDGIPTVTIVGTPDSGFTFDGGSSFGQMNDGFYGESVQSDGRFDHLKQERLFFFNEIADAGGDPSDMGGPGLFFPTTEAKTVHVAALLHKSSLTGTFPSPHEFTRYGRTEGVPARSCD